MMLTTPTILTRLLVTDFGAQQTPHLSLGLEGNLNISTSNKHEMDKHQIYWLDIIRDEILKNMLNECLFVSRPSFLFRECDGKGSLHEPHGGAGLWSHRPRPGPPASGRPGWAWAGAEGASSSSQSHPTARVSTPWAGLPWNQPPLLIQTWAMNHHRAVWIWYLPVPENEAEPRWCVRAGIMYSEQRGTCLCMTFTQCLLQVFKNYFWDVNSFGL